MRDTWNWTWWKVCSHFSIQCKPSKNQASGTVPKCVFCSPHGLMSFVSEVSDEKGAERSSPCLWAAGCHGSSQGLTQHVLLLPTHLLWPNVGGTTNGWAFSLGESEFFCSSLTVLDSFHPHSCSASGTGTVVYQRGRDGGEFKSNHKTEEKWVYFSCSLCPGHSRECHWGNASFCGAAHSHPACSTWVVPCGGGGGWGSEPSHLQRVGSPQTLQPVPLSCNGRQSCLLLQPAPKSLPSASCRPWLAAATSVLLLISLCRPFLATAVALANVWVSSLSANVCGSLLAS